MWRDFRGSLGFRRYIAVLIYLRPNCVNSRLKVVEVQLPDGRRVRLQVPQDKDPQTFATDFMNTVEDES